MKIKFGRADWSDLIKARGEIRSKSLTKHVSEIREKLMSGLADAIDAEIDRIEMAGQEAVGLIALSIDLQIEPYRLVEYDRRRKRNLLAELDDALNAKNDSSN